MISIINTLQEKVDEIAKEKYGDDSCSPNFIVSQYEKKDEKGKVINHEIMLTIIHCEFAVMRTIFPRIVYKYGYEPLENEIMWLYNTTM